MVFEASDGRVVAVEVKASATVERKDFRWLELLRAKAGDDFVHGFVLYCGNRPFAFGDRLTAVLLSYVWESSPAAVELVQVVGSGIGIARLPDAALAAGIHSFCAQDAAKVAGIKPSSAWALSRSVRRKMPLWGACSRWSLSPGESSLSYLRASRPEPRRRHPTGDRVARRFAFCKATVSA